MLENNFYVYRHIRPDTNEVFYIGIGNNNDKRVAPYARANNKGVRRSEFWRKIVNKNNGMFICEIMYECNSFDESNAKEMEFIELYGRKDLGTGTLVNLTSGGSGAKNVKMSDEVKKKHSEPMKGAKNKWARKVINVITLEVFDTVSEVDVLLGKSKGMASNYLRDKVNNPTPFMYLDRYNNLAGYERLMYVCKSQTKSMTNKTHSAESKQKMSENSINKGGRKVVDVVEKIEYPTASEASRVYGINIYTLIGKLNGRRTNNTNLRYADGL